jgi:transposase, IS30 family
LPYDRSTCGRRLSKREVELAIERSRAGEPAWRIAEELGCHRTTVARRYRASLLKRQRLGPSGRQLSFAEREQISRGAAGGKSARAIARELGRAPSTVTRELARNGGRRRYRALSAQGRAFARLRRPKQPKLSRLAPAPGGRGGPRAPLVAPADLRQTESRPPR